MNWITSIELGKFLIAHPDVEYECQMRIGGGIYVEDSSSGIIYFSDAIFLLFYGKGTTFLPNFQTFFCEYLQMN